eukprot:TRINITY_DN1301_c0_g1_i2.p1 TRINITY_DN1301_c0_g1~~TRINITY_DN1301_c0_g1_i2.p1  ORF type:complete len:111 (+),score=7.33 TRINITY_DN1301_c0_g1_i2:38-334(+)
MYPVLLTVLQATGFPVASFFIGYFGAAVAMICASFGAAYGTMKCGVSVAAVGIKKPDLITKSLIPVIMSGMVGIYGLIISIFLSSNSKYPSLFIHIFC